MQANFSSLLLVSEVKTVTKRNILYVNLAPFQNSSTLSRLLKVVEDFGEAFTKYLECSNETEKIFSFVDISKAIFIFIIEWYFYIKIWSIW